MKRLLPLVLLYCGGPAPEPIFQHSSAIALTKDGRTLYVANADSDSIGIIDLDRRALAREIALGAPVLDADGTYTPQVMPRALALSSDEKTLYATGQRSGALYVIDLMSSTFRKIPVCSEPIGVVTDDHDVYVACSQDDAVARVDPKSKQVSLVATESEPWALAWSPDGLVATHFLTPRLSVIDTGAMKTKSIVHVPEIEPRDDRRLAHGIPRGFYDAAIRPKSGELWAAHVLLGIDTAQPNLDFESTIFPALTIAKSGAWSQTLSIDAPAVPGIDGAFGDIVSGPHAMAFTKDGAFALLADTSSEDVLIVDAQARTEKLLLRPLPGHQPEAIVLSPDETHAYVWERNTNDIVVVALEKNLSAAHVEGAPIPTLSSDPMPPALRLGQHIFNSANSDELPITTNHWVSCASCHLEGRSDAVTWRFEEGPRDTPSNAGGMLATGFLFRTADRVRVQDYWRTINIEQGGAFDPNDAKVAPLLDAVASYVNFAIPFPVPPTVTKPDLAARGQLICAKQCASCHARPKLTDSGTGNPMLDLSGTVLLHDINTCSAQTFVDVAHKDIAGHMRAPCAFDTPTLRGISSSAPYLHDGSAPTLRDAIDRILPGIGAPPLSSDDEDALVAFLRTL